MSDLLPRLPSNFKGASFLIESTSTTVGRDFVTHKFTHRDDPYLEDMGGKEVVRSITGYIATDGCNHSVVEARTSALLSACSSYGAGPLQLGLDGATFAMCGSCVRNRKKDKQGYLAFDMEFTDSGGLPGLAPVGSFISAVRNIGLGVSVSFRARVSDLLIRYGDTDAARDGLYDALASFTPIISGAAVQANIDADELEVLTDDLTYVARFAENIVSGRMDENRELQSDYSTERSGNFIPIFQTSFGRILDGQSRDLTINTLEQVTLMEVTRTFNDISNSTAEYEGVRMGALNLFRVMTAVYFAAATLEFPYTDRRAAMTRRGRMVEAIQCLKPAVTDQDVLRVLQEAQGKAVEGLGGRITDLAPLVVVEATKTLPSLYWSNRIYGTAERAGELTDRNQVGMTWQMPLRFEAEATGEFGVSQLQRTLRNLRS